MTACWAGHSLMTGRGVRDSGPFPASPTIDIAIAAGEASGNEDMAPWCSGPMTVACRSEAINN